MLYAKLVGTVLKRATHIAVAGEDELGMTPPVQESGRGF